MHRPGMAVQTPGGWPKGAAEVAASQGASTAVLTTTPSAGRPSAPPPGAGHTAGAASADGVASCQPSGLSWLWTLYKIPRLLPGTGQHSCPGPICLAAPLLCLLEYFYQVESRKTGSYINILSFQSYCSTYCLCQEFQKSVLKLKS